MKASFTIHIEHSEAYHAISNTKETRHAAYGVAFQVQPNKNQIVAFNFFFRFSVNGRVKTDFEPTPIMSTFLIAFVISDFVNRTYDATTDFPTTHRIFASDSDITHTSYALGEAIAILSALENYLQVAFVIPKMDQVVVPKVSTGGV